MRPIACLTAMLAALLSSAACAQPVLKVLADEPLHFGMQAVVAGWKEAGGSAVSIQVAPSPALHKRLLSGESADVVIVQPDFVESLKKASKLANSDAVRVGRAGFGLAMPASTTPAEVNDVQSFRTSLLAADKLVFNDRSSGNHFAKVLEHLGIAETVQGRVVRLSPSGVFQRVGEATTNEIGVGTIPQIVADSRLRLVGPLPSEFQSYIVYEAAALAGSQPSARDLIQYLISPAAKKLLAARGITE